MSWSQRSATWVFEMPTSRNDFTEALLDLIWSLWEELGVPGTVPRRHSEVLIDPEPLIVFTAIHGRLDPRLRDESIEWALAEGDLLSKARMNGVRRAWAVDDDPSFARYAATVNAHSELAWPDDDAKPFAFRPRGRASVKNLASGALIALRLRAIFGVSARAEILRVLVTRPETSITATELAEDTAYVRKHVLRALDSLRRVGLVRSVRAGAQTRFTLARRNDLVRLVGDLPGVAPRWHAILLVFTRVLEVLERVADQGVMEASVSIDRFFAEHEDLLEQAGIEPLRKPQRAVGLPGIDAFDGWAARIARSYGAD